MTATAEQQRATEVLLQQIQETAFPSGPQLDRIEGLISTRDELKLYIAVLTEKVEGPRFPARQLLERLERLLSVLQRYDEETRDRS
jgi:hypothetical protein